MQFAAGEGTRIFFYTTRDSTRAVSLPAHLLTFGDRILPYDNAHFAAVPAGVPLMFLLLYPSAQEHKYYRAPSTLSPKSFDISSSALSGVSAC